MKKTMTAILLALVSMTVSAQLANTKWVGTIKGDNPRRVYLNFLDKGCSIYTVSDSSLVEVMATAYDGNQFSLNKIDGQSDCDNATTGKYSYQVKKDSLFIKLVEDACEDRSSAITGVGFVRFKPHHEVKVDPAILKQYVGTYQFTPDREIIITFENNQLQLEGPKIGLPKLPLVAISNNRFFLKIAYVEMEFVRDASGKVTQMISHEEKEAVLKKIK